MTTMRVLLTRAIRRTRALPMGDMPEAGQMAAALEDAQAMFMALTNRTLTDVLTAADYTAKEDERVFNTSDSPITVTLPEIITDHGVQRAPRNGAVVEVVSSGGRHIYVADLGAWKTINGLTLTSEQPFGPPLDDALSAMLAATFCDTIFQRSPTPDLVAAATSGRYAFDARFQPPINVYTDRGLLPRRYFITEDTV